MPWINLRPGNSGGGRAPGEPTGKVYASGQLTLSHAAVTLLGDPDRVRVVMTNTHGGARPKVRDDDGRGGARRGAGPKIKSFTLKLGDVFAKQEWNSDGHGVLPSQIWTVTEITRTHIRFQSNDGETVRLIR